MAAGIMAIAALGGQAGAGNDIASMTAPKPGCLALLGIGGPALMGRRRK